VSARVMMGVGISEVA